MAASQQTIKRARPWRRAVLWLAFLGPFFFATYNLANYFAARSPSVGSIVFEWEHYIPFWPWTIYPYWTIDAFYALSIFLAPTARVLDRHALRLLTAQIIAVCCFLIWPLSFTFGQPAVEGPPALLFDALRGFDKPFNQAPSLHITLAVILWDFYRQVFTTLWARAILHVWTLAICLSVLTTFQHHFIDIPTGALLGVVCIWMWPLKASVALVKTWRFSLDKRRLSVATLYGVASFAFASLATWGYSVGDGWLLWLWWPACSLLLVACIYLFATERSFGMSSRGQMRWSARWIFAPYRVAATLNTYLWTKSKSAQEVVPGVWLAGMPATGSWLKQGKPVLVSFCAELQAPIAATVYCLPMLDMLVPARSRLIRASALIERAYVEAQRCNTHLQVCCALGYSRSATSLAFWLVRSGRCSSIDDAVKQIRRVRPQIVLSDTRMNALRIAVTTKAS
jgi:hypothetical protein